MMNPVSARLAAVLAALALSGGVATVTGAAQEQSLSDQGEARREAQAGTQLSLREIERRILPQMRGAEYLGPAYDSVARAYRLKFIREGRVTYIDVDARTGRVIGRSH